MASLPRLGFAVRVFGLGGAPAHAASDGAGGPHLSVSLAYLRDILIYLGEHRIRMYRLHARLLPFLPAEAQRVPAQIAECAAELAELGAWVRGHDLRLSFHPYSAVVLNTPNEDQLAQSMALLTHQAALFDALGLGPEAVIVLHVGGVYDDHVTSRERFVRRYAALPAGVRRRLALENDDHRFSLADVRAVHAACGIPLVLDALHHQVHNPAGIPLRAALAEALATWPPGVRPKVHFSTPRTELGSAKQPARNKFPTWTEHSDFVNPFEFITFLRLMEGLPPADVMLEAKARDLALLALRRDLRRFAPDLAHRLE